MKEGGNKLARVMEGVLGEVGPGVKLSSLDKLVELLIRKEKGFPSFKKVKNYRWATCININQGVVHGIPGESRIKKGDLVSLDIGIFFQGFHTDMARTILVPGSSSDEKKEKFLEVGRQALTKAIAAVKPGNRIGNISLIIGGEIKKGGLRPIEALTGHGVGRKLHEDPLIPCLLKTKLGKTDLIRPGMTFAIEVIYTQGSPELVLEDDGWTVATADGLLAGLFEDTVAVTKSGPRVLTGLEAKGLVK